MPKRSKQQPNFKPIMKKNAQSNQNQSPYPRSGRSFKYSFRDTPSPDIERTKKAAPPKSLSIIND